MKRFYFVIILFYYVGYSQTKKVDTVKREVIIEPKINTNEVLFNSTKPVLEQIAGAPKAFYSHYWEFGDGHYSKEENPTHIYKKKGEYEIKHWATNNYDTGKPPTTRPKKIVINSVSKDYDDVAIMSEDFNLQRNREPMPEEDMAVVLSYKNEKNYATNGKLYLFYNEKQFKADNFIITDIRTHHDETEIIEDAIVYTNDLDSSTDYLASSEALIPFYKIQQDTTDLQSSIENAKFSYQNSKVLKFSNLKPNEERNIFFTLETTPEMIKDTSAIVTVRGIYIPDENYDNHSVKDMEMEIVTSHDPNKMSSNGAFMNYRLVRFKTLKYKIKFQNNGEGPARTIRLETDIPDMLDKSTIEVVDMYPKCKICPKKEVRYSCLDTSFTETQAIFTFKNIYLPGSEQKNVKDYDSTKGFVKYTIKFGKNFHKKKTKSRTAIIFDKNEPIITNYSTTRFLPGISIGAKAGYNHFPELLNSKSYFFGATISPYKSYRWYWQVELLNSFHKFDGNATIVEEIINNPPALRFRQRTTSSTSFNNIDWEVPVLMRYNVNNYIGLGAGLQGTISISEQEEQQQLIEQFESVVPNSPVINTTETSNTTNNSFSNFRTGLLFEITGGFSRIGPSLGARYVINFKDNYNYWQFYAIWKF